MLTNYGREKGLEIGDYKQPVNKYRLLWRSVIINTISYRYYCGVSNKILQNYKRDGLSLPTLTYHVDLGTTFSQSHTST